MSAASAYPHPVSHSEQFDIPAFKKRGIPVCSLFILKAIKRDTP
jgi:hypothetical protein